MTEVGAPYDARAVANLILDFADRANKPQTQLSLLKIIYFAHGWFLVKQDKPLVSQPIESWKDGPVIKVVRDAFKKYGSKPIRSRASKTDLRTGEVITIQPTLSAGDKEFVYKIFLMYAVHNAWTLRNMTHETGSPWDALWNTDQAVGRFGLRLRNEDIRRFFYQSDLATTH